MAVGREPWGSVAEAVVRYRVRVILSGPGVRPVWAPGIPLDKDKPQGSYVGVCPMVEEWTDWIKQWCGSVTVADRWSERLR